MQVFSIRLKNDRSWSDRGIALFIEFMSALKDGLDIKTLVGTMTNKFESQKEQKPRKHYVERPTRNMGEVTRNNVSHLKQATGKSVYRALKGLEGF